MFTVKSIKAPTLIKQTKIEKNFNNKRWEYDVFLDEVSNDRIVHANITQDQKTAHIKFIDGNEKDIMLPLGYDHVSFLIQHDVEVNIIPSETLFSPLDICLFTVQLIFLGRFVLVDWASKNKAKQDSINEINKKREKESIQKSAQIITEVCVDSNIKTTKSDIEVMRNDLMMSMSGAVAEDIITGVYSDPVGPTNDITHILRIGYQIVLNYDIFETPEQINSFVIQTYKQCRILLRRNLKCLRRLQKEFLNKKPDKNIIKALTSYVVCDIEDDTNKNY